MTKISEKINEMTNEDLREKILSLNREQLKLIKDASCYIGYSQVITLQESLRQITSMEDIISSDELESIKDYLNIAILQFQALKDANIKEDSKLQERDLIKRRQELADLSSIIVGYQIELSYIGEIVDEYGIKLLCERDYKNAKFNSSRVEELINYIFISLDKAKNDYNKYINMVSELILILPMRLVKSNYFDILKKTIIRNLKSSTKFEVDHKIEDYKKQFDSSIRDGYGTKFDYYFREVQKLRKMDFSNMNLEELDNVVKDIMELTKEINQFYNFIFGLGLLFNKILVINLLKDIPISEEVIKFHSLWEKAVENNDGDGNFRSKVEEKIQDIEAGIFSSLEEFNSLNNEALSRRDFDYEKLKEELLYTRKVLTVYNDINLLDYNKMISDEELVTNDYLDQKCDSLTQYVNRSLIKMSNIERKIRMRRLLSLTDLPFAGIDEFSEYIRYSLDNRGLSNEEINFKIDYILYFLEELPSL